MENGKRLCFSPEGFQRFLSVLHTRFGSAGDSILYSMAYDFGRYDTKQMLVLLEQDKEQGDERDILTAILDSISSFGWGDHKIDKFDLLGGDVSFTISDNPTLDLCETGESPQCYFMKGVLSGMIKEITEVDFQPTDQVCRDENNVCHLFFKRR